jgi:hypothetical protein
LKIAVAASRLAIPESCNFWNENSCGNSVNCQVGFQAPGKKFLLTMAVIVNRLVVTPPKLLQFLKKNSWCSGVNWPLGLQAVGSPFYLLADFSLTFDGRWILKDVHATWLTRQMSRRLVIQSSLKICRVRELPSRVRQLGSVALPSPGRGGLADLQRHANCQRSIVRSIIYADLHRQGWPGI